MCDSLKLEVLIAAVNKQISLYNELNLDSHCIIANQCNSVGFMSNDKCKYISTNTRGVGKNRNIALMYSSAKYILFGDDDINYVNNLEEIIVNCFNEIKNADVLIFNIETTGNDEIAQGRRQNRKVKRVRWYNYMNYGAVRIACRRERIFQNNIWFSDLFGGGAKYSCGEDTIFLSDCLKNKLKIYCVPITIATVDQSSSSWFNGYNEKYFIDKGALLRKTSPIMYRLFIRYYAFKMRTKDLGYCKIIKLCKKGAKEYYKK